MNVIFTINDSPWGSTLGVTALRMATALRGKGMTLEAIFFREDGVYHAQRGRAGDHGTPDLFEAWKSLAETGGTRLLVCSTSALRNLPEPVSAPFREAGLPEFMELMRQSDRVVAW